MRRYAKYKPSGVEWIGEIPEGWEVQKLKRCLSKNDGGVWGSDFDGISTNATKVFRSTEINIDGSWNFNEEPALRVLSNAEKGKALLKEGDLIVTKSSGSQNHIGKTALVTKKIENEVCCYSNFIQRLRPFDIQISKYLHIFLNSQLAREQYNYYSSTTTGLANLSADLIGNLTIPLLPLQEQKAIADFLDERTAKIDKLVENKLKLIELLKEERTAIINRAVTKGIDPSINLKPSGVDWLGDIPEHWELKKLKYVAEINSQNLTDKEDINLLINYIDISSVDGNGNINPPTEYLYSNAPSRARRIVKKGDCIVSTVRTYLRAIAYIGIDVPNLICSTGFAVVRANGSFNNKYMFFLMRSEKIIDFIMSLSKGVSYPAIDSDDLKNIYIWYPDLDTQEKIVEHIKEETSKIDTTISKVEKEIELLKEYRTALISEAVTGKIKVI